MCPGVDSFVGERQLSLSLETSGQGIRAPRTQVPRNTLLTSSRPLPSFPGTVPGLKAPLGDPLQGHLASPLHTHTWRASGAATAVWGSPTLEGAQCTAPPAAARGDPG